MPITIPDFSTTAVITGDTLVSQADNQFNIMMDDIKTYIQNTYNSVVSGLESAIVASLLEMQALYDSFDDRYLGVKTSNPTLDNDGNALLVGSLYFNSTIGDLRIYNGSTWLTVTAVDVFTKNQVQNTLPAIGLDTSLNNTPNTGQFTWNTDDNTVNVGLPFNIVGQMFQESFIPVKNTSGITIANGRPVMAVGTTGNSGKILINYHNGLQTHTKMILGLTTSTIANNQASLVTVNGKVRDIDTTGSTYGETWSDGDVIYVKPNSNGLLTNITPNDTELKMPIAFVVHAHASGTLLVRTIPVDENHSEDALATKVTKGDNILVNTAGLPSMTNDFRIQVNGYVGHKVGWRDLVAPFTTTSPGSASPTLTTLPNGIRLYKFAVGESMHASYHVDHDYAEGTGAYHHIHWFPETAMPAGTNVVWRIFYVTAKGHAQGESLLSTRTSFDVTYTSPVGGTTAGNHIVTEASDAQAYSLKEPDTVILAEIQLISKTFTGNVYGIQADLHYLSDREVTISKKPNFNVAV